MTVTLATVAAPTRACPACDADLRALPGFAPTWRCPTCHIRWTGPDLLMAARIGVLEDRAALEARRLRGELAEGLAEAVELAGRLAGLRGTLAGHGAEGIYDPDYDCDEPFLRAVRDLVYAAHVAHALNPGRED